MRVGFDAALLGARTTGIGRYTAELSAALAAQGVSLVLMGAHGQGDVPRRLPVRSAWFALELPFQLRNGAVDLFHGVGNFALPLWRTRVPYVLTVHDLIPELCPETVSAAFRWQFRLWLGRSLTLAAAVVCVSETTRRDLLARHPIDPHRVHVVPNGVDHVPAALDPAQALARRERLGLPADYLLYAGALDARRDVATLVSAFRRVALVRRDVALVIAGQDWYGAGAIRSAVESAVRDGVPVRSIGYLEQADLVAAMAGARAFVFPSRYEGFGLPPLEAMRLGTPAIVSAAGALPEVCGEAALVVPPGDAVALADALKRVIDDRTLCERLSQLGRERAARFTWSAAAKTTAEVYRRVLA